MALLDENKDLVNVKSMFEMTPLHIAAEQGFVDVGEILIERGAEIDSKNGVLKTPLMLAFQNKHSIFAIMLMNKGADVNAMDHQGRTPMMYAIDRCVHDDLIKLLLKRGADPHVKDSDGRTTLMYAAPFIYTSNVAYTVATTKILIGQGVDINATDKYGNTALMYASQHTNAPVAFELLENGADINAVNEEGKSAIDFIPFFFKYKEDKKNAKILRRHFKHLGHKEPVVSRCMRVLASTVNTVN